MKKLWAPWRLEFILNPQKQKPKTRRGESIFATLSRQNPSYKNLLLYKGQTAFVLMNKFPYSNGHLLVLPLRQVNDLAKLNAEEHTELGQLMAVSTRILKKVLRPEGFNIGLNLGKAAGAGILDHLHYHIVPRWSGDTNFMPIFAETKVLPEHLRVTYEKIKKEFDQL